MHIDVACKRLWARNVSRALRSSPTLDSALYARRKEIFDCVEKPSHTFFVNRVERADMIPQEAAVIV